MKVSLAKKCACCGTVEHYPGKKICGMCDVDITEFMNASPSKTYEEAYAYVKSWF